MKRTRAPRRPQVTFDGDGVVGNAGAPCSFMSSRIDGGLTAAPSAVLAPHCPSRPPARPRTRAA